MERTAGGNRAVKAIVLPYHPDLVLVQLSDGSLKLYGIAAFVSLMVERMLSADSGTVPS